MPSFRNQLQHPHHRNSEREESRYHGTPVPGYHGTAVLRYRQEYAEKLRDGTHLTYTVINSAY